MTTLTGQPPSGGFDSPHYSGILSAIYPAQASNKPAPAPPPAQSTVLAPGPSYLDLIAAEARANPMTEGSGLHPQIAIGKPQLNGDNALI